MNYIDLHTHSNKSDGTLTPCELVTQACNMGLAAIALTDHDTIVGIDEAIHLAAHLNSTGKQIELVPGIELSSKYGKGDIHILGLLIDHKNTMLNNTLVKVLSDRIERNHKMIKLFNDAGIPMTLNDICGDDINAIVTRAHFARYLIENKYVKDNNEAFKRYLGYESPFYVKRSYMTPDDAIRLIKNAGGIPVLAHPFFYGLSIEQLEDLIRNLKETGLEGIETIYSTNSYIDENIARKYASRYNLLMTGGSDFHGTNKPHIQLGIGKGNLRVPYTLLDKLKHAAKVPNTNDMLL